MVALPHRCNNSTYQLRRHQWAGCIMNEHHINVSGKTNQSPRNRLWSSVAAGNDTDISVELLLHKQCTNFVNTFGRHCDND
jgi:hypothetical protein